MATLALIGCAFAVLAVWMLLAYLYTEVFGFVGFLLMPSPVQVGEALSAMGAAIEVVLEGLGTLLSGD